MNARSQRICAWAGPVCAVTWAAERSRIRVEATAPPDISCVDFDELVDGTGDGRLAAALASIPRGSCVSGALFSRNNEALEAAVAGHLPDMLTVAMLLRGHHMAVKGSLPGALARAVLGLEGNAV